MAYVSLIASVIGTGIKLLGSSGGPNYPSAPTILGLPVQQAKKFMESYESRRMKASIDAWKSRFPLLYKGGGYEIEDIGKNQQGLLSDTVKSSISKAGLEAPKEGDQYHLAADLGLNPITLSQRTSQAYTRQIALNPEWTNKISGGTLATMIANNYKNQNAFSQFLGSQNTAKYVAGQTQNAYNTQALLGGVLGAAKIGFKTYEDQYGPLSPVGQGAYQSDVTQPGYYLPSNPTPSYNAPAPTFQSSTYDNNLYNNVDYMPYSYLGNMDTGGDTNLWTGGGSGF